MSNRKNEVTENIIVGIGASADGIHALEVLFGNMPVKTGLIYIVIQHLSPDHISMLSEILQRKTDLQVLEIENNMEMKADHIYVAPPGYDISIDENRLITHKYQKANNSVHLPIDFFLRSLASKWKGSVVALILTGAGSDGILGLKAIKSAGGVVMVQDPETAKFNSMPQKAVETGLVDFICSLEDMPRKLMELKSTIVNGDFRVNMEISEELIDKLFGLLKMHSTHDFSEYKKNTIQRQVQRRMLIYKLTSFKQYIDLVENNPEELEKLFDEILIGVTSFFRNKDSFASLEKKVFPELVNLKNRDTIRIWVVACATGEEVYSIAILLKEYMEKHRIRNDIQIFATDIDNTALNTARTGNYPKNIETDVPKKLLSKYFEKKDSSYQIHQDIRDMIVFAEHSAIKDPPFSRLHLISCRNLLIYLESNIQKHLMNVFHYALLPQGYLFLGNSESQSVKDDLFITIDSKEKIYQKKENRKAISGYLSRSNAKTDQGNRIETKFSSGRQKVTIKDFAEKKALSDHMHPFLIIDKLGNIQYSLGKCDNYFTFHVGEPQNIINAAREGLKIPLSNALRKVNSEGKRTEVNNIKVPISNGYECINLVITPNVKPAAFKELLIVTIEPSQALLDLPQTQNYDQQGNTKEYIRQMEQELEETREFLNNVIEEHETSNQELKLVNELAQSTNEELQSTNEELETSKEEMQSLNEELETSNTELIRKIEEITSINNDLNNFLRSTQIGTLFLDKNMHVRRFTPQIKNIVNLQEKDIGRSIRDFGINFLDQEFFSDISKVLEKLTTVEKEISKDKDNIFWMRILPYRTLEDKIDGVVITFTNVTEKYRIKRIIKESEKWKKYKQLFEQMDNGFALFEVIKDKTGRVSDFRIIEANHAYEELMQVEISQIRNKRMTELKTFENFHNDFMKAGKAALAGKSIREDRHFPDLDKYLRILYFAHEDDSFAMLIQDITVVSKELKAQHHLVSIVESSDDAIYSVSTGGEILTWNDGAAKLYGYRADEVAGKIAFDHLSNINKQKYKSVRNKILNSRNAQNFESVHTKKDGTNIPVSVTISPILDSKGKVQAFSYIVKDITFLKEREKELLRAKEATEQAANLKANFLANMSHEIRTPLNSILGFTEILDNELDSEQQKSHLDTIYQSGIQLLHLINDIVDLSRIDAGELHLSITDINLISLLNEIKNQFEGFAVRTKNETIKFSLQLPEITEDLIIRSDEYRIKQIFHNLLSNAFKYTEEGLIEFGFKPLKKPGEIVFFVHDTGIGISKKDFKTIFDRFKQGDQSSRYAIKGTGLGLAISKALAELLGGKMWLESEKGKGSVFYFTIDLQKGKYYVPQKDLNQSHNDKTPQFPGKKILLAEDDFYSTEMIQYMLKETGTELYLADDGAKALELFNSINPDLVLLDIRLPKIDGNKIITKIREKNPDVPVIAQSAYAMPDEIQKSKKRGFTEYLTKPISQVQLYTVLKIYLKKKNDNAG